MSLLQFADPQTEPPLFAELSLVPPPRPTPRTASPNKAPHAYRTISEVAGELNVPQHVLRFWETKFSQLKPLKRGGGRRYYRSEDISLLHRVHTLLYKEGYTIKGAQKVLSAKKGKAGPVAARKPAAPDQSQKMLATVLKELKALRALV
jgi:DNA-binding transcriptional MerR regulator